MIKQEAKQSLYGVYMNKKVSIRQRTKKNPCSDYKPQSCQYIIDTTSAEEKFGCRVPILNFGKHFRENISLPECNNSELKDVLNIFGQNVAAECRIPMSCKSQTFSVTMRQSTNYGEFTIFDFEFTTPEVVRHHTYVAYDLLSFIGEIGGLLGLTLGLSALSITEILFNFIKNLFVQTKRTNLNTE